MRTECTAQPLPIRKKSPNGGNFLQNAHWAHRPTRGHCMNYLLTITHLCKMRGRRTAQLAAHPNVEVGVQVLQPLPVALGPCKVDIMAQRDATDRMKPASVVADA